MGEEDGFLIEILLPLTFNDGAPVPEGRLDTIRKELIDRFGGLTAFTRSPAEGVWHDGEKPQRDEVIVLEIMTDALDHGWWREWRTRVEQELRQDEIVVRAREIERL